MLSEAANASFHCRFPGPSLTRTNLRLFSLTSVTTVDFLYSGLAEDKQHTQLIFEKYKNPNWLFLNILIELMSHLIINFWMSVACVTTTRPAADDATTDVSSRSSRHLPAAELSSRLVQWVSVDTNHNKFIQAKLEWNEELNSVELNLISCCVCGDIFSLFMCARVITYWKFVSTIFYKPLVGISPDWQLWYS